jgi:ribose 5-phosphate isomerase B
MGTISPTGSALSRPFAELATAMKIAVGCDHRGFAAKRELLPLLKTLGHRVEDFGCDSAVGVDYPDIAYPLAMAVASQACDLGILINCNGIGMTMVANKIPGVRAATVCDEMTARCAREHYHCNIIGIGVDLIAGQDVRKIVEVFLSATVANGRHARRIEKLRHIEELLADAHNVIHDLPRTYSYEGHG